MAKPVEWAMRRELLSPAYTTRWPELMVAKARQRLSRPCLAISLLPG
ncbi:DUF4113 domain-containing protein [Pseudomonas sp.]|nr:MULTISPECIES: DUF4113 domain-containing protein [unclassified Pseudomonas]